MVKNLIKSRYLQVRMSSSHEIPGRLALNFLMKAVLEGKPSDKTRGKCKYMVLFLVKVMNFAHLPRKFAVASYMGAWIEISTSGRTKDFENPHDHPL